MNRIGQLRLDKPEMTTVRQHGLLACVQCGKCSAVCPLPGMFPLRGLKLLPRMVIHQLLLGRTLRFAGQHLWYCLTCRACADVCPAGVRFADFIAASRDSLSPSRKAANLIHCQRCGSVITTRQISSVVKTALPEELQWTLHYCPVCTRYVQADKLKDIMERYSKNRFGMLRQRTK